MLRHFNIISRCVKSVQKNNTRLLNYELVKSVLASLRNPEDVKPPYNYIVRAGDPILREKTVPVDLNTVKTEEFQKVLSCLHKAMIKHSTIGLAAPQIGLPWQLFAVEITESALQLLDPYYRNLQIEPCPLTFFINPVLKVTNSEVDVIREMCESIPEYAAEVPRAKEIEIEAYDRNGDPFSWKAKDWLARVIQHEYDHLQGRLYIDTMLPRTFKIIE